MHSLLKVALNSNGFEYLGEFGTAVSTNRVDVLIWSTSSGNKDEKKIWKTPSGFIPSFLGPRYERLNSPFDTFTFSRSTTTIQ